MFFCKKATKPLEKPKKPIKNQLKPYKNNNKTKKTNISAVLGGEGSEDGPLESENIEKTFVL